MLQIARAGAWAVTKARSGKGPVRAVADAGPGGSRRRLMAVAGRRQAGAAGSLPL